MSVASLNLYHHGKHHIQPVPKWISRLFFFLIPKLIFMNVQLPVNYQKQRNSILKPTVKELFFLCLQKTSILRFFSL
jgi:hypothetical protein